MENSIQCLHCGEFFDSEITILKTLDLVRKHVRQEHPDQEQI